MGRPCPAGVFYSDATRNARESGFGMATIRFEHIWKRYGPVEAVKDLNLTCQDGKFLALLGPSGCGKTSSLRMLAGLEAISEGDLFIGDQRVNDLSPKDRDIAMVFEDYALYPHMSVYHNIAFPLKIRNVEAAEIQRRGGRGLGLAGAQTPRGGGGPRPRGGAPPRGSDGRGAGRGARGAAGPLAVFRGFLRQGCPAPPVRP